MEKEIYNTKKKQNEREKSFVLTSQRRKRLEKLQSEIIEDIIDRLKNDKFLCFNWGDHILTIIWDEYYYEEYSVMQDRTCFWIANNIFGFDFHEMGAIPAHISEQYKEELWQLIHDAYNAQKLDMTYKDYLKKRDEEKTKKELKKQKKIEEAKKILEKYQED